MLLNKFTTILITLTNSKINSQTTIKNHKHKTMKTELKKAIIDYIFENVKYMQIINQTKDNFRAYIYDKNGKYLIGGEEVGNFIREFIKFNEKY